MILSRLKNDQVPELALNDLQLQIKFQVEKKIKAGEYKFETTNCPICEKKDFDAIGQKDRYGLYYPTNICKCCGLVLTSPRMRQRDYNEFYNNEYRKLYVGTSTATDKFFKRQQRKGKRIYSFLASNKLINNSSLFILEVGCGAGGILDIFRAHGHSVKGIDLGKEYINYGRQHHNLNLLSGTLLDLKITKKPDIIIYSHVLEHILDLKNELEVIKQISHKNTVVYIEVPGIKNIANNNYRMNILRYFQNAHTFHFSLTSLKNLMSKYGFDLIYGNELIVSAFKYSEKNQESFLINDYSQVKSYIIKMERLRRLYPMINIIGRYTKLLASKIVRSLGLRKYIRKLKS